MNECMNNFYRASPNYNRIDCDKNKEYSLDKQMKKQQQKQEHTHTQFDTVDDLKVLFFGSLFFI